MSAQTPGPSREGGLHSQQSDNATTHPLSPKLNNVCWPQFLTLQDESSTLVSKLSEEGEWYEPPTPSIISERGPQTPSVFPPPSPYSSERYLEVAVPTSHPPPSLELGPPRAEQPRVCFGCAVIGCYHCYNAISLCLHVLSVIYPST